MSFQKLAAYPPSPTADTFLPGDYLGADMNRDGRLDLLEYDGAGAIGIWLGREDGTFVLSSSYATTGTGHTWNLPGFAAVGDFTEDGLADVVVLKTDLRDVQVLPGLPGGGLTVAAGKPIVRISIGDVDADRHLDVAFVPAPDGAVASNVVVLRGSGRGTFTKVKDYAFPDDQVGVAALADWDGNATLDLLVQGMNGLHILNGNGDGSFADDQQCPIGALLAPWFTDLNQDGQLDIVWHPLGNRRLATVLGQGGCSFSPFTSYSIPFDLSLSWISLPDFVVGDVTGDGLADVLTGNSGAAARFLAGQADGTFAAPATVPVDSLGSPTLLLADVNSDGRADVVAAGPHGIEVYANTCDP